MVRAADIAPEDRDAWRALQAIPNVGPAIAEDLLRLGFRDRDALKGQDPLRLYRRLCDLDGMRYDPCVLDTFMAVVDHADTGSTHPWWHYTPTRKALHGQLHDERS